MESKDEVSDTDSGIILQSEKRCGVLWLRCKPQQPACNLWAGMRGWSTSTEEASTLSLPENVSPTPAGPDSPVSPMKELTHAVHKQQRALEARLEACLEELRRLCLREAELTGTLPPEYPLKPGEKAPKVRRRIGAAYKLDDWALHREAPFHPLTLNEGAWLRVGEGHCERVAQMAWRRGATMELRAGSSREDTGFGPRGGGSQALGALPRGVNGNSFPWDGLPDPLGSGGKDPLSSLERQLALQLQITEAARRLCLEENLSRQARRQRKHSMLQEEKKLQELQRCLLERRRNSEPPPAAPLSLGRGEPAGPRAHGPCPLNELWRDGGRTALCHRLCIRLQLGKATSWVHLHPILTLQL
ncbi:hypothetical protein P7K49_035644 [Saguinus oedipus]|uniref:Cytohesin Ubiquitin Protein Inducing domain-containing protein n=1 Tax=Saguinus oedipus TaxID=9490 RepID=A0ABQ9TN72_SAGOE|nr:hypothetical protein P7K49_035644 [Saguinus oedipus]